MKALLHLCPFGLEVLGTCVSAGEEELQRRCRGVQAGEWSVWGGGGAKGGGVKVRTVAG